MIITYFRSSSFNAYNMCPMSWFAEYGLGWRSPPNIKAEKGTVVHKVLEILAEIKLAQQNDKKSIKDEICGRIICSRYNLDKLVDKCYDYYATNSPNVWTEKDRRDCRAWVYKAIEYKDGIHDPRNNHIIKAEQSFDFEIRKPWAMYEYKMPDGREIDGFLSLKGTIDQISKVDDETYQILDWKTGRRLNWATGEEKTYAKLVKDPQLMLYFYAIRTLYPEVPNFEIVIDFINDGGPFTICTSVDDIPYIENMIMDQFNTIRNQSMPQQRKTWRCSKFCHFGKSTFEGTNLTPIRETRPGRVTPVGEYMTKCEQIQYCLDHRSIDSVMKHMTKPGHSIDYYHSPGSVGNEQQ